MSPLARVLLQEISEDPRALADLAALLATHLPDRAAGHDRWMTTKEAAAYLGLTPNALHKLTAARAVPFEQETSGGKCWFLRSELEAWRRGQR